MAPGESPRDFSQERRFRLIGAGQDTLRALFPKLRELSATRDVPTPEKIAAMVIESTSGLPDDFLKEAERIGAHYRDSMTQDELKRTVRDWSLDDISRDIVDARAIALALTGIPNDTNKF